MKNIFISIFFSVMLLLNVVNSSAQNNSSSKKQTKTINYSKYIGKTVEYFFSHFNLPIQDTIGIREYFGVVGFILKLDSAKSLYVYPQVINDSANRKRKIEDSFDLIFFYHYNIRSILYRKNGKTIKVYGKYNGRLKD